MTTSFLHDVGLHEPPRNTEMITTIMIGGPLRGKSLMTDGGGDRLLTYHRICMIEQLAVTEIDVTKGTVSS